MPMSLIQMIKLDINHSFKKFDAWSVKINQLLNQMQSWPKIFVARSNYKFKMVNLISK